jgi:hypothetical protein
MLLPEDFAKACGAGSAAGKPRAAGGGAGRPGGIDDSDEDSHHAIPEGKMVDEEAVLKELGDLRDEHEAEQEGENDLFFFVRIFGGKWTAAKGMSWLMLQLNIVVVS